MEQTQPQPPVFNQPPQPVQPAPQYQPRVTASPMMQPVDAVKTCLRKYCDFKGRARRSEYWWFVLFNVVVTTAVTFLLSGLGWVLEQAFNTYFTFLPLLGSFVVWMLLVPPQCAVLGRRMHDTGHGAGWAIVFAVAMVAYYVCYFYLMWGVKDAPFTGIEILDIDETMKGSHNGFIIGLTLLIIDSLVVMVTGLITLIFSLIDSKVEKNQYGPSPKYQSSN